MVGRVRWNERGATGATGSWTCAMAQLLTRGASWHTATNPRAGQPAPDPGGSPWELISSTSRPWGTGPAGSRHLRLAGVRRAEIPEPPAETGTKPSLGDVMPKLADYISAFAMMAVPVIGLM